MPVAWNESERLAARSCEAAHAREFFADTWCYMLSNNTIKSDERTRVLAYMPAEHLLAERYYLSFLLRRALGITPDEKQLAETGTDLPSHLGGHAGKTQFDEGAFDHGV